MTDKNKLIRAVRKLSIAKHTWQELRMLSNTTLQELIKIKKGMTK